MREAYYTVLWYLWFTTYRAREIWHSFLWRRLGFIECNRRDGLRFRRVQVIVRPGIGAKLELWRGEGLKCRWGLFLHPLIFAIYIRLWETDRKMKEPYDLLEYWGFDWTWTREWHFQVQFGWPGKKKTFYDLPWAWDHLRTECLTKDGKWVLAPSFLLGVDRYVAWEDDPRAFIERHPYTYVLRSGKVQERIATVTVKRWEWTWKISKMIGLEFPKMIRRSIEVQFNDEVGERSGSWKGGCLGTCQEMWYGERPVDTLRRMERERRFN